MRKITLLLIAIILGLPMVTMADSRVNLTPVPKSMTVGNGTLVLPQSFTIATGELADSLVAEATKFANHFAGVTGYTVEVKAEAADALITMSLYNGSEELGLEGYTLEVRLVLITMYNFFCFCYFLNALKFRFLCILQRMLQVYSWLYN